MTQGDDNDQEDVVLDRVDHAVAARPDAECVAPLELLDIRWTRVFRQQGYGPLDPSSDLGIQLSQSSKRRRAQFDPVAAQSQPRSALASFQGMFGPSSAIAASNAATSSISSSASIISS